jgi:hypothetical protein
MSRASCCVGFGLQNIGDGEILRCAQNDVLRATPTATVCGNGNGMRQWQKHMAMAKAYGNGEWAG